MISKIKVGKQVFENPRVVGFCGYEGGDGFLLLIEEGGRRYAIAPLTAKVYDVIVKNNQFLVEIPYGGRTYRAPLRFKL